MAARLRPSEPQPKSERETSLQSREVTRYSGAPQQQSEDHVKRDRRSARAQLYSEALQRLQSAIDMLDRANAPGHIAAHVDLAMHQLQDVIDAEATRAREAQLQSKGAPKSRPLNPSNERLSS